MSPWRSRDARKSIFGRKRRERFQPELQPLHGAPPGIVSSFRVIRAPFVAEEAMLSARIDVHFVLARLHRETPSDGLDFLKRNARVLLSEKAQHGDFDAIGFRQQRLELEAFTTVDDASSVKTNGGGDIRS